MNRECYSRQIDNPHIANIQTNGLGSLIPSLDNTSSLVGHVALQPNVHEPLRMPSWQRRQAAVLEAPQEQHEAEPRLERFYLHDFLDRAIEGMAVEDDPLFRDTLISREKTQIVQFVATPEVQEEYKRLGCLGFKDPSGITIHNDETGIDEEYLVFTATGHAEVKSPDGKPLSNELAPEQAAHLEGYFAMLEARGRKLSDAEREEIKVSLIIDDRQRFYDRKPITPEKLQKVQDSIINNLGTRQDDSLHFKKDLVELGVVGITRVALAKKGPDGTLELLPPVTFDINGTNVDMPSDTAMALGLQYNEEKKLVEGTIHERFNRPGGRIFKFHASPDNLSHFTFHSVCVEAQSESIGQYDPKPGPDGTLLFAQYDTNNPQYQEIHLAVPNEDNANVLEDVGAIVLPEELPHEYHNQQGQSEFEWAEEGFFAQKSDFPDGSTRIVIGGATFMPAVDRYGRYHRKGTRQVSMVGVANTDNIRDLVKGSNNKSKAQIRWYPPVFPRIGNHDTGHWFLNGTTAYSQALLNGRVWWPVQGELTPETFMERDAQMARKKRRVYEVPVYSAHDNVSVTA